MEILGWVVAFVLFVSTVKYFLPYKKNRVKDSSLFIKVERTKTGKTYVLK